MLTQAFRTIFGEERYFRLRWLLKHGPRYAGLACYWPIDGWLPEQEAVALYDAAMKVTGDSPVMVEIGSWQGKSSVILAKAAKHKRNGLVYCIDPFDASGDDLSVPAFRERLKGAARDLKDIFLANITGCGVAGHIRVRQGKSSEVAVSWSEKIDLLFIDGDHSYEGVKSDFLTWTAFIKPGGFLLLHDVRPDHERNPGHCGGPYRLVQEYIKDDPRWGSQQLICSLFIAQKKP